MDRLTSRAALRRAAHCPDCGGSLEWNGVDASCTACGRQLVAAGETPQLLPLQGAPPPPPEPTGARQGLPGGVARGLDRYRRFLRPSTTYKSAAKGQVAEFASSFAPDALILNIGAGTRDYGPNVLNLDIAPLPGVGVVAVAESLPFGDEQCDGVILQAVLEHVVDENETLGECYRVLRTGGRLLVEIPFIQGDHPAPGDYRRYTEQGVRQIVERHGFRVEASGVAVGPASALTWVLAEFLALLVSVRSARAYRLARVATTLLVWPLKFLDRVLDRHPMARVIASGVWVVGAKPPADDCRRRQSGTSTDAPVT